MKWPAKLTGTIPLASWLNAVLESARSCQIQPGVGYRVKQSLQGTTLEIDLKKAGLTIGGVISVVTNYTATASNNTKLISFNSSGALTLTLPATPPSATWFIAVECVGAGGLTINPSGLNIDSSASSLILSQNQGVFIYTDGTNYFTMRGIGGGSAQMFVIKSISNADYVVANTWDGTTRGSSDIYIAKSPRLRPSVGSENIDGVTITYSSYTSDNTRMASDGTNSEYQVAFPRYVALASGSPSNQDMSIIFACASITGLSVGGLPVSWIEVSPARVWARRYIQ
jgi:hypothetical protein